MSLSIRLSLSFTAALLLGAPARADVAGLRANAEARAQGQIQDLLRSLCPEQCTLLSVEAKVEEETVGNAAPGFEGLAGGPRVQVLRGVKAHVVADSQLPSAFRTRLKNLLLQRLAPLGPQNTVNVESVAYPPRNAPHLDRQEQPLPPAEPEKKEEEPLVDPRTPWERLQDKLIEAAPLLTIVILLVMTLIVLGALFVLALRRQGAPAEPQPEYWPEEPAADLAAKDAAPAAAAAAAVEEAARPDKPAPVPAFPPERFRKLERALHEERGLRNAVVRQALRGGDVKPVAIWTREFGEFVLEDLRGDEQIAQNIPALAAELRRPEPPDASSRNAAMYELEGRLIGARLAESADPTGQAFAFLEGISPDRFAAAVKELPPAALDVALRFAPSRLRAAALDALPTAQRGELVLALARRPDVSTTYALSVAEDLRARVLDTASGASQLGRVLGEVVDSLSMADQDRLLDRLRREGSAQLANQLLTESTLKGAPVEILSAALLTLPPARLVSYLSNAEAGLRDQLINACPVKLRGDLVEELQLKGKGSSEEFLAARRELLQSVSQEISRRGLMPSDLRGASEAERN